MLGWPVLQVAFDFASQAALPVGLELRPASGVAPPKSQTLVAMRFSPRSTAAALSAHLTVVFNCSAANSAGLSVRGRVHEPALTTSLAPSNRLFLRPTCVGSSSTRHVSIVNPGRVPVAWQWVLSRKLSGVVAVKREVCVVQW